MAMAKMGTRGIAFIAKCLIIGVLLTILPFFQVTEAKASGAAFQDADHAGKYVSFGGRMWRVATVTGAGQAYLVMTTNYANHAWNPGGNNADATPIFAFLNTEFENIITHATARELIAETSWTIRNQTGTTQFIDGSHVNPSEITQKLGIISVQEWYEYGSNIGAPNDYSWTRTPQISINEVTFLASDGKGYSAEPTYGFGVRPVLYLKPGAVISGGQGTLESPYTVGIFQYTNNGNGTATITGQSGLGSKLVIPGTIAGLTVTAIGEEAFHNIGLTELTLPNTVTSIGERAFFQNGLTRIIIPESVLTIGDDAFNYNYLQTALILNNATEIGHAAFSGFNSYDGEHATVATIIGHDPSTAKSYAALTGFGKVVNPFVDISTVRPEIAFEEDGNPSWAQAHATKVMVTSVLGDTINRYQWTNAALAPAWDEEDPAWQAFASGEEMAVPEVNGTWYLHIHATDTRGSDNMASSQAFNIDRTAPIIGLAASPTEPTNGAVTITATIHDGAGSGVAVRKWAAGDHEAAYFASGSQGEDVDGNQFSANDNGTYTVYAKDHAGNEDVASIQIDNIDRIAPDAAIFSADNTAPTNGDVQVTIDYPTDAAVQLYKIDDGAWTAYTGAVTMNANGTVYAQSRDLAGNESIESSYVVGNIDKVAPVLTTVGIASSNAHSQWAASGDVITLTFTASKPLGDEPVVMIASNGAIVSHVAGNSYKAAYTMTNEDDEGEISFAIDFVDLVGNAGTHNAGITVGSPVTFDRTPPDAATFSADKTTPTNGDVQVTIQYPVDAAVKSYKIDDGAWTAYTGAVTMSANGTVYAQSRDLAGNGSAESRYEVSNIDRSVPNLTYTRSTTAWTNQDVAIHVEASAFSGMAVQKWAAGLQTEAYFETQGQMIVSDMFSISGNGDYTIYVEDVAGNKTLDTFTVTNIDKDKPKLHLTSSPTILTNQDVTVTADVYDDTSAIAALKWTFGHQTADYFEGGGTPFASSFSANMNGTYSVYAVDQAGNREVATIAIHNISREEPIIHLTANPTSPTHGHVSVTVDVYAPNAIAVQKFSLDVRDLEYFDHGGEPLDEHPIEMTENGWLSVYVKDIAGNETLEWIEIANIDRQKPEITLIGKPEIVLEIYSRFDDPGAMAADNLDGDISHAIVVTGDEVLTNRTGTYELRYNVQDRAGNEADEATRIVKVVSRSSDADIAMPTAAADTEQVIDSAGGRIQIGGVMLTFPQQAVEDATVIRIQIADPDTRLPLPDNAWLVSQVYEITRDREETFRTFITITLPYDLTGIDLDKVDLAVYWLKEETNTWIRLDNTTVDAELGLVSGEANHFTKFAVLATEIAEMTEKPEMTEITEWPKTESRFTDVRGHWAEDRIAALTGAAAIDGYPDGTFQPDRIMTRAEFVSILMRVLATIDEGINLNRPAEGAKTFDDTADHWAKDAIAAAHAHGLVSGYEESTFGANDPVTREQMAAIVMHALKKLEPGSDRGAAGAHTRFTDQSEIDGWAQAAVQAASGQGILSGYPDGSFQPKRHATRAEAATVLVHALL